MVFFGGTFDPVHLGHVALVRAALTELQLERLTVLPAGNPYQRGRTPFASAKQRVAMLRLAFVDHSAINIDERELHREGATYTVDTLTEIRAELGADIPFVWLIGSGLAEIDLASTRLFPSCLSKYLIITISS